MLITLIPQVQKVLPPAVVQQSRPLAIPGIQRVPLAILEADLEPAAILIPSAAVRPITCSRPPWPRGWRRVYRAE